MQKLTGKEKWKSPGKEVEYSVSGYETKQHIYPCQNLAVIFWIQLHKVEEKPTLNSRHISYMYCICLQVGVFAYFRECFILCFCTYQFYCYHLLSVFKH